MTTPASSEDFVLTVVEVFELTGRGTVAVGPIEQGVLWSGEQVQIWSEECLLTSAPAFIELINTRVADLRTVSLVFRELEPGQLAPGYVIRRPVDAIDFRVMVKLLENPRVDLPTVDDAIAARLVAYTLGGPWGDHWASAALDWIDQGVWSEDVAAALTGVSHDKRYSQRTRHRAWRYIKPTQG